MEAKKKFETLEIELLSAKQVLVVEDDEGLNNLAQKSLRRAGFNCQGVLTGADAIERVKNNTNLVLLLDQRLPDMDGTDLARTLIHQGYQIPFIAMTGNGDEKVAVEMMKLGARDYLVKDFDLTDILPMVFRRLFCDLQTEQKLVAAEETLRENEIQYKALLETTKAIAYEIDFESLEFKYISPQIYEFTGYPVELWKDFEFWSNTIHPDDRYDSINFCMSETKNGKDHEFEYRMITADNSVIWIKDLVTLIKNGDMPISLRGFLMDITPQKKMEAQLRETQKMESIGNLSGGIAHDFNNILFPIVGMSELLMEDLKPESPEHQFAGEILKAAMRGSELVKQILAFSRQSEHKLIPTKIQSILKEVINLSRSTIPSNVEISEDIQSSCDLVMADSTQLHQVAMNLITNAFHAVEKQNGKITIQLKDIELNSDDVIDSSLLPGKYARISVVDTGCGIDPAIRDRIFDPYFTTKEQGKGTGLGLAVVFGIVKEHQGDIKVLSELGKGSKFIVYFPLIEKSVAQFEVNTIVALPTGSQSILLVDDDAAVVGLEIQMLERLGYKVTSCTNSIEALEKFKESPDAYDLVVTDMTMPKMTGDHLAREILSIRPEMPIIICTGFSEKINKEQAEGIGVKGFLMKPVVKHEMAHMVRKALDEKENNKN